MSESSDFELSLSVEEYNHFEKEVSAEKGFNFGASTQKNQTDKSTSGFSFGATPATASTEKSRSGFSFGATSAAAQTEKSNPGFSFGANPQCGEKVSMFQNP